MKLSTADGSKYFVCCQPIDKTKELYVIGGFRLKLMILTIGKLKHRFFELKSLRNSSNFNSKKPLTLNIQNDSTNYHSHTQGFV